MHIVSELVSTPVKKLEKLRFDYSLEALRGLAALFVVGGHALGSSSMLDPAYQLAGWWQYVPPGHLSVIIFFLLSGYVIGLSNPQPITTNAERKIYLKKRLVRLYPLYLFAIALTVAVAFPYHELLSVGTIAGNLFFLQDLVVKVPTFNQPLWSLSYEISYYLLFLLVSARQWRAERVATFFLVIALVASKLSGQAVVLASYAYGAVFWFLGLYLVHAKRSAAAIPYGKLLALIILLLSYDQLNLLHFVLRLNSLHLDVSEVQAPSFFLRAIVFSDLSYLVLCIPLLLCFTNRTLRGQRELEWLAFAMPALGLGAYVASGKIHQPGIAASLALPIAFYVAALGCYAAQASLTNLGKIVMHWLTPFGLISYGIYIIHYPILFLFQLVKSYSGTPITFAVRLVIYFSLVLGLGWLLERKIQPWIKKAVLS